VPCAVYRRRPPEHTPLYRAVQGHLETYLALRREGHNDGNGTPQYVETEFRRCLECAIARLRDGGAYWPRASPVPGAGTADAIF
jgi:hypothetical protein